MEKPTRITHQLIFKSAGNTWEVFFSGIDADLIWTDLYISSDGLLDGKEPEQFPDRRKKEGISIGLVDIPYKMDWGEIMQKLYAAGLCSELVLKKMEKMGNDNKIFIDGFS